MKRVLIGTTVMALMWALSVTPAQADAFLSISVDGVTLSCSTTNVPACSAGFVANPGGNQVTWLGFLAPGGGVINGVSFPSISLVGNSPGGTFADLTDTKNSIMDPPTGTTHTVTISFAENGYTSPASGFLGATQNATWTNTPAGNISNFTAWLRTQNDLTIGNSNFMVTTQPCVSPATQTPVNCTVPPGQDIAVAPPGAYALSGQEVLTILPGSTVNLIGSSAVRTQPVNPVPEPGPLSLLVMGMTAVSGLYWLKRR